MAKKKNAIFNFDEIEQQQIFVSNEELTAPEFEEFEKFQQNEINTQQNEEDNIPQQTFVEQIVEQKNDASKALMSLKALTSFKLGINKKSKKEPEIVQQKTQQVIQQVIQQQFAQQTPLEIDEQLQQIKQQIIEEYQTIQNIDTKLKAKEIIKSDEPEQLINNQVLEQFDVEQKIQQVVNEVEEDSKEVVKIEIEDAVEVATENIENFNILDIDDISVETVKGKTGYTKTKVTIKDNLGGEILSNLATKIKKLSNNVILHRKCDLRLIGNTNKTQLKSFQLKLTKNSYTFKPVGGIVNKSTRVILSIPDNYSSNKPTIYIYIQKSRDKFIKEFDLKTEADINWLAEFVTTFYDASFSFSKQKLNIGIGEVPLLPLMSKLTATKRYEVSPIQSKEDETEIVGFFVRTLIPKNQWLIVRFHKYKHGYVVHAMSRLDRSWKLLINNTVNGDTIFDYDFLKERSIKICDMLFETDWTGKVDILPEEEQWMKMTYRKLKEAYTKLSEFKDTEEGTKIDLNILDVYSKIDTAKILRESGNKKSEQYEAESILGKTKYCDAFIISYLAVQTVGGDKRHGKDYITSQDYYEKYNVSDRRKYNERKNTVLVRQNNDRNYNARTYKFQLQLIVDGKNKIAVYDTFDQLLKDTGLLTSKPKI